MFELTESNKNFCLLLRLLGTNFNNSIFHPIFICSTKLLTFQFEIKSLQPCYKLLLIQVLKITNETDELFKIYRENLKFYNENLMLSKAMKIALERLLRNSLFSTK